MKIDINLDQIQPNCTLEFSEDDVERMWYILQEDRWWFEEQIINYLIDNIDNLENDELAVELMNKLNTVYANA